MRRALQAIGFVYATLLFGVASAYVYMQTGDFIPLLAAIVAGVSIDALRAVTGWLGARRRRLILDAAPNRQSRYVAADSAVFQSAARKRCALVQFLAMLSLFLLTPVLTFALIWTDPAGVRAAEPGPVALGLLSLLAPWTYFVETVSGHVSAFAAIGQTARGQSAALFAAAWFWLWAVLVVLNEYCGSLWTPRSGQPASDRPAFGSALGGLLLLAVHLAAFVWAFFGLPVTLPGEACPPGMPVPVLGEIGPPCYRPDSAPLDLWWGVAFPIWLWTVTGLSLLARIRYAAVRAREAGIT